VKAIPRTTSDVDVVVLAYLAGQDVPLEAQEREAALRRALFVFAAGGDLHRDPTLDDPAVIKLAEDLDSDERRKALLASIDGIAGEPQVLERLQDPGVAWRAYACGLLADTLGEDAAEEV
jgi:hypothetical protein